MKKLLLILAVILIALFLIKRKNMTWRQSFLKVTYPLVMLKAKLFPHEKAIQVNEQHIKPVSSFYELKTTANNGTIIDLAQFKGKKILLVNTASDCGFTAQYNELEKLHQQYKDKLVILGFPANDFKQQEKADDGSIAEFCKINFGVSFQLMHKSQVIKGPEQNMVFDWLSHKEKNGWCDQQPVWNFSKYLVNEEGILTHFFATTISPLSEDVQKAIKN
ncbi:MAG: glutathione peroxidase [Sediminibacterium sp.]|nr:glutathione peroxidase [Sediminibacterium sp.]